jgi:hypothetical protein
MLQFLVRSQLERERAIAAVLNLPDGNPTAQAKIARKLEESCWPFVLDVRLKRVGKRGRYELCLATLDGWSAALRRVIMNEGEVPAKPWLALGLHWIESRGNHRYDESHVTMMMITHHALSRLAQRSGVRTVRDLVEAVDAIWVAYANRVHAHRGLKFPDGHRLQFQLADGGNALAVLNHDRNEPDNQNRVVVATII